MHNVLTSLEPNSFVAAVLMARRKVDATAGADVAARRLATSAARRARIAIDDFIFMVAGSCYWLLDGRFDDSSDCKKTIQRAPTSREGKGSSIERKHER